MASYAECLAAVGKAATAVGRDLSEDEVERVFTRTHGMVRRFQREGLDPATAAYRAGEEIGGDIRMAAVLETRNAAINLLRRQAWDFKVQGFGTDYAKGIRSALTGTEGKIRGQADSVDAAVNASRARAMGGVIDDLRQAGALDVLLRRDKAFDRDISREMWRLTEPAAHPSTGNQIAANIAAILHKHQERVRLHQNAAGAWIGKEDHYVTRQSHDMMKVRGDGSPEAYGAWRDGIADKLDERTFDRLADDSPAEREAFLRGTWENLASGMHDTARGSEVLAAFTGPANMAKKASAERVLHFRDADAWFDYNAEFGKGGVLDGVMAGIDRGARNAAVMEHMGTNPKAMLLASIERFKQAAKDANDFKQVDKLGKAWNEGILDQVTGQAAVVGHNTIGAIGSGIRNMQNLAKLGGVMFSNITDVWNTAATLQHNGVPLWEGVANQAAGYLPGKGAARREVADLLGVGSDGLISRLHNRFRAEDGPLGFGAQAVEKFHRYTLLTPMTDAQKGAMGDMIAHSLARNVGKDFGTLGRRYQNTLTRYGIGDAEWRAMREASVHVADGRAYVLAHTMETLPDSAVAHLVGPGLADTPSAAKLELSRKVQTYTIDQVREGMSESTAGTRTMATLNTQSGDASGELVRTLMQFKSFSVQFTMRTMNREFRRDGVDVGGVAGLIVGTTMMGYAALTLKELAKGRDVRKPDDLGDAAKLVMAAAMQGGGAGLYGDFLFGKASRMGGGPVSAAMGPTVGTMDDFLRVMQSLRDGSPGKAVSDGLQAAKANTPFINLWYTRMALDYLVLYGLQEKINPGFLRRHEAELKRDNDQTYWLRPSEVAVRY